MGETVAEASSQSASPPPATRPPRRFEWRSLALVWPILASVAMFVGAIVLLQGLATLSSWNETFGPTGTFTVSDCTTQQTRIGSRVECEGSLVTDDGGKTRSSVLIGPAAAFGTKAPRSGTNIAAYYRRGSTDRSFPQSGRSIELARAIIGVVPLIFLIGGLGFWLVGWILTRDRPADQTERTAQAYRWRQRSVLRSRGSLWASVGLAWYLFDRFFVDDLVGSVGLG